MACTEPQKIGMKSHPDSFKSARRRGIWDLIENSVENKTLQNRLKELRIQGEGVLSNQEKEIKYLYHKISNNIATYSLTHDLFNV